MSIRAFLNGERFDDQQIEAMDRAFEEGDQCAAGQTRRTFDRAQNDRRLIEAAKDGQRDPHKLCIRALGALKA